MMVEAESSLSREVKMNTLTEEITRRLRNTSLELDTSQRLEIMERACTKMKTSGHSEEFIRQAVEKGIGAFEEKVERSKLEVEHPGYQPLYPKAGWRKNERSKEKALKRGNWFKGEMKRTYRGGLPRVEGHSRRLGKHSRGLESLARTSLLQQWYLCQALRVAYC
jgi:hypothetical protein